MKLFILGSFCILLSGCGFLSSVISSTATSGGSIPSNPMTSIALIPENYTVVYDGEGSVDFASSSLTLSPKASTAASETHAALVLIKETVDTPVKDFELTVELSTDQQLRQNTSANDWEVFWLFFGYNGTATEKTSNYFISKPSSGAELGLAHGKLGQQFISTDIAAKTNISVRHTFKFRREGDTFTVYRDNLLFYSFIGTSPFPQTLYNSKGALGFYTEDAKITIYSVSLTRLDGANTVPAAILPQLFANAVEVKAPLENSLLSVAATNTASTGPLFWSCTYKKIVGDISSMGDTDCLSLGGFTSSGNLNWAPSFADIGSWLFDFEASEQRSGFASTPTYVQIRPKWTSSQLFLYDSQFNLEKNVSGANRIVTRDLASENNKTSFWPNLINTDALDLSSLAEVSPWGIDSDTQLTALHFDGNQNGAGLPLPVSNLGTTQDLRLSYWFKRDNSSSKVALSAPHGNGVLESRHWFSSISSRFLDGATEYTCDDPNPATDEWTFVTTQVLSGNLKTYVNGREVCNQVLPSTYDFLSPFSVAPLSQTFYPFAGKLSEIAGYKQSTAAEIFADFLATADRYRRVKVGAIAKGTLALHWDAANADQGMRPSVSVAPLSWFDLGPTTFSKVMGNFDGTASSGFVTTPAATSHLKFDGVDDYIQIPQDTDLSLGPTWTIEAWVQPGAPLGFDAGFPVSDDRYPLYKTIFEKAHYDNPSKLSHGFGLRIGPTNTVDAFVVNNYGFTDTVQGTTALANNQWYHVAVSFNKATSQLKSYVNGVLESTHTIDYQQDSSGMFQGDGDILSGDSDAYLGVPFDADGRRRFNGRLSVLRVYGIALSDAQIKAHCQVQASRFSVTCPGP